MIGQRREDLCVHGVAGRVGGGEDVDEDVGPGQGREHVASAITRSPPGCRVMGCSAHLGAEALQHRGEGLPDAAEAPDQHARAEQRGEASLGVQGLQAAELVAPLVALLGGGRLEQAPHEGEQQCERVLAHRRGVQARTGRDHHLGGEAGGEDPLDPGGEGLHQAQLPQLLGGGGEVGAGGAPDHERGGVVVLGGDRGAGVDDDGLPALGQLRDRAMVSGSRSFMAPGYGTGLPAPLRYARPMGSGHSPSAVRRLLGATLRRVRRTTSSAGHRVRRAEIGKPLDTGGFLGASVTGWISTSPSFLPRTWWMWSANIGLSQIYGYAAGVLAGKVVRRAIAGIGLEMSIAPVTGDGPAGRVPRR